MSSLSGALSSAVSGLRATQTQMEIISGNVANSGTVGYSRRQATLLETGGNGTAGGVRVAGVQRLLDTILQRELRTETAGSGYSAIKAGYTDQIQKLLGTPGSSGALDGTFNSFTKSLQALATNPSDSVLRASTVTAAQTLAQRLNSISNGIQDLRNNTELALSADVSRANDLLQVIATTDLKIAGSRGRDPALLDQRDAAINELSKLMDLRVTESSTGTVSISTEGGLRLYENGAAVTLGFDPRGSLGPNALYSTGSTRGVGTITVRDGQGNTIDAIGQKLIRSGEIAALIDMRDTVLVEAQTQLDAVAAALARAVSDRPVASTATTGLTAPAAGLDLDISGLQAGNVITVDTTASPGGAAQRFSFVRSDSAATTLTNASTPDANDTVIKLDYSSATPIATQIQNALPAGFTVSVSGNTLRIVYDTTTGPQLTGLSTSVSSTALSDAGKELPLFIDGASGLPFTGSPDGATQQLGFAARIAVNPSIVSDPSWLVRYATTPTPTLAGDPARPTLLYDRLTKATSTFSSSTGIGQAGSPFTRTVGEFLTRTIEAQASNASAAKSMDDGQKVVQASIESRFAETSGVNVDSEMANLIQVQNAYAANARIVSAVKDMFDLLMRM